MPCEDCINRREFLAVAGAASLVAVAGCGDGVVTGPFAKPLSQSVVITVGDFPQLATAGQLVRVPNTSVAVKRTGASSFDALSMVCTHQGCLVNITNGEQFDCPCHASRFSSDGMVLRGPASTPLPKHATSYDPATDRLTIS